MSRAGEAAAAPRAITPEYRLAHQFLATLENPRAPWAARYDAWAKAEKVSGELRLAVKVTILRLRTFGAIERSARRRRAAR